MAAHSNGVDQKYSLSQDQIQELSEVFDSVCLFMFDLLFDSFLFYILCFFLNGIRKIYISFLIIMIKRQLTVE